MRDLYALPEPVGGHRAVLIVATDRLSAFDVVLPTPIAGKGRILTGMSLEWFRFIESRGLARTHVLGGAPPEGLGLTQDQQSALAGRSTVARECRVVPVECVVRGYLDGSGWKDYQKTGGVCGIKLPAGLERGSQLPEPVFTPATKAQVGEHDENISFAQAASAVGEALMQRLREISLSIYAAAHEHARSAGLILADTKFEFGVPLESCDEDGPLDPDAVMLIDEALTPDSSRYWEASAWNPGSAQESFDKQFVRDYLQGLCDAGSWDQTAPGPELPADVVRGTVARYEEAAARLFPHPSPDA